MGWYKSIWILILIYSITYGTINMALTKSVLQFFGGMFAFPIVAFIITMYFAGFYYLFFKEYFGLDEIMKASLKYSGAFVPVAFGTYGAFFGSILYLFLMGYFMYKKTGKLYETIYVTVFPTFILLFHLSLSPTQIFYP